MIGANSIDFSNVKKLEKPEMHKIATKISKLMSSSLVEFGLDQKLLYDAIFKIPMYFASFDGNVQGKYYYKTNSIYISDEISLDEEKQISSSVIHEIVHYLQSELKNNNKVVRMGLFKLGKMFSKDFGVGINEASVQYLSSVINSEKPETVKYFGIDFETPSSEYYPLETTLIRQMAYFTGTYPLFFSTLFSNDIFETTFAKITSKETYSLVSKNIDYIIQLQDELCDTYEHLSDNNISEKKKVKTLKTISSLKEKIRNAVITTQELIYIQAFENELEKIDTVQDCVNFQTNLNNFENYIFKLSSESNLIDNYELFRNEISVKLSEKLSVIAEYGNYSLANKISSELAELPKIYSPGLLKTLFSKIKLLVDLRFSINRATKEELYEHD